MAIVKISDLPLVDSPVEGTDLFVVVQDNVTKKAYASDIQTYVGFEEVQTATAGQTVFNLTTMTYAAGANNLQVFVDGVNQYVGTSYLETDNNTVTFTQGLHQGALVKFSTVQTLSTVDTSSANILFTQGGTGAVTRSVQSKLRDSANAEDYGAVGDGVTDDTAAIQAAANAARVVNFQSKTYKIAGTVLVPSNTWFSGQPGTQFLGIMTPQGGGLGGYPNQMFRNADTSGGNANISFTNIKFNFAKGSFNYVSGPNVTSINSLLFAKVENLYFGDCEFFDFVTNYNTNLSGIGLFYVAVALFDSCSRVTFERFKTENIREEGPVFYDCFQVSINGWRALGKAVATSSHASFYYCDGVVVSNARISHNGGSVLNGCAKNVLYENIVVNEGETQEGRGMDFGNEVAIKAFDIANISVIGCTLNVGAYGIYLPEEPAFNDVTEGIEILNNRILVKQETAGGSSYGVLLLSPKTATIENNYIYMSNADAINAGICTYLKTLTTTSDYDHSTSIQISGNYMRGLTGVWMQQNNNTAIDGVYVDNNTFISQNKGAFASSDGASVFFYIRNNSTAVSDWDISNIYITNNSCWNLGGGYFVMTLDTPANATINNVNIMNNRFVGVSANMDRSFQVYGGAGTADIRFCYNTVENGSTISLFDLKYALLDRNVFRWSTEFTGRRVNIVDHDGTFEMVNNRFYNVSQSSQEDVVQTTSTFDILAITGNSSKNAAGTLAFTKSTLPANTTLPN